MPYIINPLSLSLSLFLFFVLILFIVIIYVPIDLFTCGQDNFHAKSSVTVNIPCKRSTSLFINFFLSSVQGYQEGVALDYNYIMLLHSTITTILAP